MGFKKFRTDIIITAVLLSLAFIAYIIFALYSGKGDKIIVYVDDKIIGEYDLSIDKQYDIETKYGNNKLNIKDGKVSVVEASCDNRICILHNPIGKSGESIICIPNHLVIKIEASGRQEVDDIAK